MADSDTIKNVACTGKIWFTDNKGNPSSMRLMSVLALLVAAGLAGVEVFGLGESSGKQSWCYTFWLPHLRPRPSKSLPKGRAEQVGNSSVMVPPGLIGLRK